MRYLRERWRFLLVLAALMLCLWAGGIYGYRSWINRPGVVSIVNYKRIRVGMSKSEVDAILGGPGRATTVPTCGAELPPDLPGLEMLWAAEWTAGTSRTSFRVAASFNRQDRVVKVTGVQPVPFTEWDRLRHRLGF